MRLFGFDITRSKRVEKEYTLPDNYNRGWWPVIHEPYTGAWQRNEYVTRESVLAYHAIFSCITLIAHDISKLRVKLVERSGDDTWTETTNPAYSPVLRKPNHFQTRPQFWESWLYSKLTKGNTYALKQRDNRGGLASGNVKALYVLDPCRTKPLVADDGDVFYEVNADNVSGIRDKVIVPAREIIHDRYNTIFNHPLCGVSPLYAAWGPAAQGLGIQAHSTSFFQNRSLPGGILTYPGAISETDKERVKAAFEEKFTGENAYRVAVLGEGAKFEQMSVTAEDAQLIDQFKLSAEQVCSAFHVPPYKVGIGTPQLPANIQVLNVEYFSQCLQKYIEDAQELLDEGLGTGPDLGTAFDTRGLLRMDALTQVQVLREAIMGGILSPNEARAELDMKPVVGGDSPMIQQQQFSLEALAKRDAKPDPFETASAVPAADDADEDDEPAPDQRHLTSLLRLKLLERQFYAAV